MSVDEHNIIYHSNRIYQYYAIIEKEMLGYIFIFFIVKGKFNSKCFPGKTNIVYKNIVSYSHYKSAGLAV